MRDTIISKTVLVVLLYSFSCVLTNSTEVNQNIVTSSKTSTNMTNKLEVAENEYNNGNNILEPSIDINDDLVKEDLEKYKQEVVGNPVEDSQDSKSILNNDTPVILTLAESSSIDLEQLVDTPLVSTSVNENNLPKNVSRRNAEIAEEINVTHYSTDTATQNKTAVNEDPVLSNINANKSENQNEEIPSFSEWAQKRLEEVEKNEQINSSSKGQNQNGKGAATKLRWKNYASLDCGAKVIAANPEAVSPGAILSPLSDEYKLNTCTSRIWFVVELCEAIQTKKIDLANYELFSSSPKDFVVSVSDRYPTRDWSVVGKFTAKDERDIQSFDLDTHIFGKYIKVEIKSHYGSEHYCPISLFRAYGTSVFEVLQKEDPGNVNPTDEDDDDADDDHIAIVNGQHDDSQKNLFSSATDAVISIVKRAAEVLGNKVNNRTGDDKNRNSISSSLTNTCITPSHMILCKNCSESLFAEVYEVLSCDFTYIRNLVEIPLMYKALSNSWICHKFGYEIDTLFHPLMFMNSLTNYVKSFFSMKYIISMCHQISVLNNKAVLNITQHCSNGTGNITNEQIINLKVKERHVTSSEHLTAKLTDENGTQSDNVSNLNFNNQGDSNDTTDENVTDASEIKPTKTYTSEGKISQTDMVLNDNSTVMTILSSEKAVSSESTESVSSDNLTESTAETTTEIDGIDTLDENLENLISDLNNENSQNVPVSTTSTTNTPQAQKESVFLRLSNRIKVLERNMSLSSQYLEELSRRYKKQVEEMQHLLEKTIVTLREESQKKDLRNKQLEDRLDNLTAVMESLVAERQNWVLAMYCLVTGALVFMGIYFFCGKSATRDPARETKETTEVLRRKSIDVVTHNLPVKKKRRPSDQALKIVRCSSLINEEDKHKSNQRQRKKKKRNLTRSNSVSNIKHNCSNVKSEEENSSDWVERNHQAIEDIPFVLEESDHTTLEQLENELMRSNSTNDAPITFNSKMDDSSSQRYGSRNVSQEDSPNVSEKNYVDNKVKENSIEPVKKERRSFKKLLKKVF